MSRTTYKLEDFSIPLPIVEEARTTAEKFAQQQPSLEKAEQVRLNTLAVWVVKDYLQMIGIDTNVSASDSWNQIVRLCANVADLDIPGVGRLECRPVRISQQRCFIPPETWEERVGYVVIQLDESLQEAKLLGFVPKYTSEELPLSQLQIPEALIEHLWQLKHSQKVNLSQWIVGIFEKDWQTIESLLRNQPSLRPAYTFRRGESAEENATDQPQTNIRRAKLIDLEIKIAKQTFMLIVEINPQVDQQTHIRVQLHPISNQIYLPPTVQLIILDDSGAVFLEAQARSADNYIQLQFSGATGECFSIKVALNDASISEYFLI